MKTITLTIILLVVSTTYAQTNVISNKSHSGDLAELYLESDDFGEVYMPPSVDTVILYSSTCIIEVKRSVYFIEDSGPQNYHDTICNHNFLPINKTEYVQFKNNYANGTTFIGFDKVKKSNKIRVNNFNQNGISWFFGSIILLIAFYSLLPLLSLPVRKEGKKA
tara:strand:- start:50870 stop:51361 length:492 start_codon:yes stop_codon:yes gene_type:complete